MVTTYKIADDIKEVAQKLIKDIDKLNHISINNIVFVRINSHIKGDHILGRTVCLSDRAQFLTNKKYIIEFPPVYDTLKKEQQEVVVEHELMHIPNDEKGLIPHDIGEFREIIRKYGLDWITVISDVEKKVKLLKEKEKIEKKQQKLNRSGD